MYSLSFRHTPPSESKLRETHCCIYRDDELIATGYTVCSPADNFNRATGRKTALNRALDASGLVRVERTRVWNTYLAKWGYDGCSSFGRGGQYGS